MRQVRQRLRHVRHSVSSSSTTTTLTSAGRTLFVWWWQVAIIVVRSILHICCNWLVDSECVCFCICCFLLLQSLLFIYVVSKKCSRRRRSKKKYLNLFRCAQASDTNLIRRTFLVSSNLIIYVEARVEIYSQAACAVAFFATAATAATLSALNASIACC